MPKIILKAGSVNNILLVRLISSTTAVETGKTGVTTSMIHVSYARADQGNTGGTTITLVAGTKGTYTANGWVEKDSVKHPGLYELCPPNAAFAINSNPAGVNLSSVQFTIVDAGSNNIAQWDAEVQITGYDPNDSVRLGLTALPNAVAGASGGLLIDKNGYALTATGLNLVLVDGQTLPASLRIIAATTSGKCRGAGSGTEIFTGLDNSTDRVQVTDDVSGNRTAITYL